MYVCTNTVHQPNNSGEVAIPTGSKITYQQKLVMHLAIAAQFPDPLGEERKGAICQESKTEKRVGTECPAGGKATNDGTVPKVRGQARKITCGPTTALESTKKATACTENAKGEKENQPPALTRLTSQWPRARKGNLFQTFSQRSQAPQCESKFCHTSQGSAVSSPPKSNGTSPHSNSCTLTLPACVLDLNFTFIGSASNVCTYTHRNLERSSSALHEQVLGVPSSVRTRDQGFLYFQGVDHWFLNMANPTTTKKTPHFTVPYRWCLRLKKCVRMLHIGFAKIPRNLWNYPQYWPSFPSSLGLAPQNPKSSEQFRIRILP